MEKWPRDTQEELIAFYGVPKTPALEAQLVDVVPPFVMRYEGKPVRVIRFHKKAAGALKAALDEIWAACGKSQLRINELGIDRYDGAYEPRLIRGSTTRWSNHAFGAAIDLAAADNAMDTGKGKMPKIVVDAFKRQGARWGGDYSGRTDPMHFEFCRSASSSAEHEIAKEHELLHKPALQPAISAGVVPIEKLQLKLGDRGPSVVLAQQLLNKWGSLLIADGEFGPLTERAVRIFQVKHDMMPDGIIGSYTWDQLGTL